MLIRLSDSAASPAWSRVQVEGSHLSTALWLLSAALLAALPLFVVRTVAFRSKNRNRPLPTTPHVDPSAVPEVVGAEPAVAHDTETTTPRGTPLAPERKSGTINSSSRKINITVDGYGLFVSTPTGYSTEWTIYRALRWDEIRSLHIGAGYHDELRALYATTTSPGPRQHVADAGAFTCAEWTAIAEMVSSQTDGRLRIDCQR